MRIHLGLTIMEAVFGILGLIILVTVVLPYYLRFQAQVKTEMVAWTGSSLNVAVTLVRAQAKLAGAKGGDSIMIEKRPKVKTKVLVNKILNPVANSQGIVEVIEIPQAEEKLQITYEVEPGARLVIYSVKNTTRCKVTYRESLLSGEIDIIEDAAGCG